MDTPLEGHTVGMRRGGGARRSTQQSRALHRGRLPLMYDFPECPAGAWKGSERMMCGQTTQAITPLTRLRAASRFLLTVGVFGTRNL